MPKVTYSSTGRLQYLIEKNVLARTSEPESYALPRHIGPLRRAVVPDRRGHPSSTSLSALVQVLLYCRRILPHQVSTNESKATYEGLPSRCQANG